METWEILCRLASLLGYRFKMKYASVQDVTAEIRRVVPIWAGLDPGPEGAVWEADRFRLPGAPFSGLGGTVVPIPTLGLDTLEARFGSWFGGLLEKARREASASPQAERDLRQMPAGGRESAPTGG